MRGPDPPTKQDARHPDAGIDHARTSYLAVGAANTDVPARARTPAHAEAYRTVAKASPSSHRRIIPSSSRAPTTRYRLAKAGLVAASSHRTAAVPR